MIPKISDIFIVWLREKKNMVKMIWTVLEVLCINLSVKWAISLKKLWKMSSFNCEEPSKKKIKWWKYVDRFEHKCLAFIYQNDFNPTTKQSQSDDISNAYEK